MSDTTKKETGIDEGNKLIAEFMKKEEGYDEHGVWQKFKYHSSWDWLMPVVEKIENIHDGKNNFHIQICKRYTRVIYEWNIYQNPKNISFKEYTNSIKDYRHTLFGNNKLKSTFFAIVDFIQWYNSQHPTK